MKLNVCLLSFDGFGHIVPAIAFAKRLRDFSVNKRVHQAKLEALCGELDDVEIVIFCQISRSDIPHLLERVEDDPAIILVVRIVDEDGIIQDAPQTENESSDKVGPPVRSTGSARTRLWRQEASDGTWARRVISFYKNGVDKVANKTKYTQRYFSVKLCDDDPAEFYLFHFGFTLEARERICDYPDVILADMFVPYDGEVAKSLSPGAPIPCWSFHPSSLVVAGFDYKRARLDLDGLDIMFKPQDLMEGAVGYGGNGFLAEIERQPWRRGVLINDVEDWYTYDVLRSVQEVRNNSRVLCVGPLHLSCEVPDGKLELFTATPGRPLLPSAKLILIAMGSQFRPSNGKWEEMQEDISSFPDSVCTVILGGLPLTKKLPRCFRTPWTHQVQLLKLLPQVRAIVTHAGWNSILETILTFEGDLHVVCMPLGAEQSINTKWLEKYVGATRISRLRELPPIMEKRALSSLDRLRNTALNAWKMSSAKNLDIFLNDSYELGRARRQTLDGRERATKSVSQVPLENIENEQKSTDRVQETHVKNEDVQLSKPLPFGEAVTTNGPEMI